MHLAFAAALAGGLGALVLQHDWWIAPRVAAEAVALVLCLRSTPAVAPFAVVAAALLPLVGHATAVEPPAGAIFVDAVHVVSAGMWAGGILALASLRPPDGWTSPEARTMLDRFGRVAVIAAGVTVLTGVLRATEQLTGIGDLWSTSYGIALALKSVGVGVMIGLSALGWRRGRLVAGSESVATVVVIGLTALLAVLPAPA